MEIHQKETETEKLYRMALEEIEKMLRGAYGNSSFHKRGADMARKALDSAK